LEKKENLFFKRQNFFTGIFSRKLRRYAQEEVLANLALPKKAKIREIYLGEKYGLLGEIKKLSHREGGLFGVSRNFPPYSKRTF